MSPSTKHTETNGCLIFLQDRPYCDCGARGSKNCQLRVVGLSGTQASSGPTECRRVGGTMEARAAPREHEARQLGLHAACTLLRHHTHLKSCSLPNHALIDEFRTNSRMKRPVKFNNSTGVELTLLSGAEAGGAKAGGAEVGGAEAGGAERRQWSGAETTERRHRSGGSETAEWSGGNGWSGDNAGCSGGSQVERSGAELTLLSGGSGAERREQSGGIGAEAARQRSGAEATDGAETMQAAAEAVNGAELTLLSGAEAGGAEASGAEAGGAEADRAEAGAAEAVERRQRSGGSGAEPSSTKCGPSDASVLHLQEGGARAAHRLCALNLHSSQASACAVPSAPNGSRHTLQNVGRACVAAYLPHRKKSNGVKSGERAGHQRGPNRPIHWSPTIKFRAILARTDECAEAPSSCNQESLATRSVTSPALCSAPRSASAHDSISLRLSAHSTRTRLDVITFIKMFHNNSELSDILQKMEEGSSEEDEEGNEESENYNSTRYLNDRLDEIQALIILMGISPAPDIELYWSSDPFYRNIEICQTMTCKRFKKILENLQVCDITTHLPRKPIDHDKLQKIRPMLTILNNTFKENATVSQTQSIHESMIKFKGRHSKKQYMPMKPVKRGFKAWCRMHGGFNDNPPNVKQFQASYRKILTHLELKCLTKESLAQSLEQSLSENVLPDSLSLSSKLLVCLSKLSWRDASLVAVLCTVAAGGAAVWLCVSRARVETKDGRIAGQRPARLYEISLQAARVTARTQLSHSACSAKLLGLLFAALLAAPPSPSLSMWLSRVWMWSCCYAMRSSARSSISTDIYSFTDLGLHDKKIMTRNDSFTDHGLHDKHIKVEGFT
ncbi:LOW QUALITY PROTEIN: hypothetical protein MSG28_000671 [Choristoneura fumiferana]|uniref:Uncharacterized protein n=1 Tax=Choristoneura fumiferana TaxID=7141 RepID=A0ACC0K2A3_CHOFU|nr:LOW QUALITY PROTEIN: hypothetical protein MSG28_000671 [Choristoneura fumiferana]